MLTIMVVAVRWFKILVLSLTSCETVSNYVTFPRLGVLMNYMQLYRISTKIGGNVSVFNIVEILKSRNCFTCEQTAQ